MVAELDSTLPGRSQWTLHNLLGNIGLLIAGLCDLITLPIWLYVFECENHIHF